MRRRSLLFRPRPRFGLNGQSRGVGIANRFDLRCEGCEVGLDSVHDLPSTSTLNKRESPSTRTGNIGTDLLVASVGFSLLQK